MFSSLDQPAGSGNTVTYGNRPRPAVGPTPTGSVSGVGVRSLPPGTTVVVGTCNSRYRLTMLGDRSRALVQGGCYFPEETEVRIVGSTVGGSLLKPGWIGLGLLLELSVAGERLLTSCVRSITVEPPV